MLKYCLIVLVVFGLLGCKTTFQKRINKDIVGINEQLYDLEKEQLKIQQEVTQVKDETALIKKKKEEEQKNPADEADMIYQEGYKSYLEQDYTAAIQRLSQLTGRFEHNPKADNALYWQAESYYKLNRVDEALTYYQLLYRYFPFSNKADYALYKIGMVFYDRKEYSKASLAFTRLSQEYPGSDLYKAALIKINQIKKHRRSKR